MMLQCFWSRMTAAAVVSVCLFFTVAASLALADRLPPPIEGQLGPENPFMAPDGVGAMHSDAYASECRRWQAPALALSRSRPAPSSGPASRPSWIAMG